jgi:hypothetical protein
MAAAESAVAERPAAKESSSKGPNPTTQEKLINDNDLLAVDEKSLQQLEKQFSLEELKKLKPEEGAKKYLEEGKKQITGLCQHLENLPLQTETNVVILHIKLGEFLNEIKAWCDSNKKTSKVKFSTWLSENFEDKHRRYFFQARQLASMEEQAYRYAYLGKNRLLEFESIRNSINKKEETSKSLDDVFKSQTYSSNGNGDKGAEKDHVDALITFHRFKNEGLKIEFSQAVELVSHKGGAITVSNVKQIKTVLDTVKTEKQKKEALAYYIKNKEFSNSLHSEVIRNSPNSRLDSIVRYCDGIDFNDQDLVKRVKDKIKEKSVVDAYRGITILAKQLGINLDQEQSSDSKANTGS